MHEREVYLDGQFAYVTEQKSFCPVIKRHFHQLVPLLVCEINFIQNRERLPNGFKWETVSFLLTLEIDRGYTLTN